MNSLPFPKPTENEAQVVIMDYLLKEVCRLTLALEGEKQLVKRLQEELGETDTEDLVDDETESFSLSDILEDDEDVGEKKEEDE
jgi:hypothetical protein